MPGAPVDCQAPQRSKPHSRPGLVATPSTSPPCGEYIVGLTKTVHNTPSLSSNPHNGWVPESMGKIGFFLQSKQGLISPCE